MPEVIVALVCGMLEDGKGGGKVEVLETPKLMQKMRKKWKLGRREIQGVIMRI